MHEKSRSPPPLTGSSPFRQASQRLLDVQTPIIPEVAQLIAEHPGTLSLGQGMVAFPPPPSAQAALQERWHEAGSHRYGAVQGEPELLRALTAKLERDNGIVLGDERWLFVTAGSNMAFLQSVLAITDPGDEVILLTPFYFNHQMAVGIAGCRSIEVATQEDYQPDVEAIERAMTSRTRALVTVSPNNPTGAVYDRDILQQINQLCRRRGVYHLHDAAYESFLWQGAEPVSVAAWASSVEHTISLYSFSKAYGMAAWRVGYGIVPRHLASAMLKIQDTNLICPPRWSQWAALGALEAGSAYCRQQLAPLAAVRQSLLDGLGELGDRLLQGPLAATARGAMYAMVEVPAEVARGRSGRWLNEQLVRRFAVAALPGETFGMGERCALRISFGALEPELVAAGVERLVGGLKAILS